MASFPKPKRITNQKVLQQRKSEPCWVCGMEPADASHIKTQGSGGPDTLWNVVAKCRLHHIEWGLSWSRFVFKYPKFAMKLKELGWDWSEGKLKNALLDQVDAPSSPNETSK